MTKIIINYIVFYLGVSMTEPDEREKEIAERIILSLEKNVIRPKERKRERFLRKYGTQLNVIKAMMLTSQGLSLALVKAEGIKEFSIPLDDKIPEYQLQLEKRKLKHIFHKETLLVDIYTKADGVVYTLEIMEYLFDELL